MNARTAKKVARRPSQYSVAQEHVARQKLRRKPQWRPRLQGVLLDDPRDGHPVREKEAWRKARGRWSPWKVRAIKTTFSVTREEVGSTPQSRITEDIMAEEDRRIIQVLEEAALRYQGP